MTGVARPAPPPKVDADTLLRQMFDAALAASAPADTQSRDLQPRPVGRLLVVGAGKASGRKAQALERSCGPCEGLVVVSYGSVLPTEGVELIEAGYPVPDGNSEAAARRMLGMAESLGPDNTMVALISVGETTVTVRGSPGRGGRSTGFLLAFAIGAAGARDISVLACDSDERDGSERNAGAIWHDCAPLRYRRGAGAVAPQRRLDALSRNRRADRDRTDAYQCQRCPHRARPSGCGDDMTRASSRPGPVDIRSRCSRGRVLHVRTRSSIGCRTTTG
ncbi:DUF4147 domain-containing protein [Psychromarinibacter sediminicola]|uniref:DUF4147 domain-containing protein n=1 Tax=Psychromarinibacter sediminicola TaxID=3033385 RepID=UPI00403F0567